MITNGIQSKSTTIVANPQHPSLIKSWEGFPELVQAYLDSLQDRPVIPVQQQHTSKCGLWRCNPICCRVQRPLCPQVLFCDLLVLFVLMFKTSLLPSWPTPPDCWKTRLFVFLRFWLCGFSCCCFVFSVARYCGRFISLHPPSPWLFASEPRILRCGHQLFSVAFLSTWGLNLGYFSSDSFQCSIPFIARISRHVSSPFRLI